MNGRKNTCAAIIVAAGNASRMGGIDKILTLLEDKPLLAHTLRPFQLSELVDEIIIVTRADRVKEISAICKDYRMTKVRRIVLGGDSRAESVSAGLQVVSDGMKLAAIHDGARPLIPAKVLDEVLRTAARCSAAAPAIPVKDTIKRAVNGKVIETPPREELFAVQTPQVFDYLLIKGAVAKALEENAPITDDCSAVERIGFPVYLTQGSEENIKITTPADLRIASQILAERRRRP